MKQQTKKRWLRVVVCVACIFLLRAGCNLQYRQKAEIKTSEMTVSMEQFEPIDFVMSGIVKVNKSKGMEPIFSILYLFAGYDDYYFKGTIRYDDKKTRLKIHWHEPIAMFSHDGDVFLLCKAYWLKKSWRSNIFSLYRLNESDRRFTKTNIYGNPELYDISFTGHELDRLYKLWCVWEVLEAKGQNEAVVLFNKYAAEDSRRFITWNWSRGKGDFIFSDLLKEFDVDAMGTLTKQNLWNNLVEMLLNTEAFDDEKEMYSLYFMLGELDKEKADEVSKRWWKAAAAEELENDHRLEIRDSLEREAREREAYLKRKSQEKEQ